MIFVMCNTDNSVKSKMNFLLDSYKRIVAMLLCYSDLRKILEQEIHRLLTNHTHLVLESTFWQCEHCTTHLIAKHFVGHAREKQEPIMVIYLRKLVCVSLT